MTGSDHPPVIGFAAPAPADGGVLTAVANVHSELGQFRRIDDDRRLLGERFAGRLKQQSARLLEDEWERHRSRVIGALAALDAALAERRPQ